MEAWIFYKCSETPVPKGKQGSDCGVDESSALCAGGDRRPRFVDLLGKQTSHVSHPSGTTGEQFAFLFRPGSPISRVSSSNLGIFSLPWTPPSHFLFTWTEGLLSIVPKGQTTSADFHGTQETPFSQEFPSTTRFIPKNDVDFRPYGG